MSQTLLAEYAFKALMNEVEGKSSPQAGREYELVTNLVLRGSTALAPSLEVSQRSPKTAAVPRNSKRAVKHT